MWPDMTAEGLAAIVKSAQFPVWCAAAVETQPRIWDVVAINGRVRSVVLELSEPRLLVQSRFRMSRDQEPDAFEQFGSEALDYWANLINPGQYGRPRSIRVKIATLSLQLEPVGFGVVGASATLETLGHPSAAVDVALGMPWTDLELAEFLDPGPVL
jgi:hypothetical protein